MPSARWAPDDTRGGYVSPIIEWRSFDAKVSTLGNRLASPLALTMPVVQTSTYCFEDTDALIAHMRRKGKSWSRCANTDIWQPTGVVESKLAALEGQRALVLSSGMAAITCTLLTFLRGRPLHPHRRLLQDAPVLFKFLRRFGVDCTLNRGLPGAGGCHRPRAAGDRSPAAPICSGGPAPAGRDRPSSRPADRYRRHLWHAL